MTQLTQEHFDKALQQLVSKEDFAATLDERLTPLATNKDLEALATKDGLKALEADMNERFDAVIELLDVRTRVGKLEQDVAELRLKLPARPVE